MAKKATTGDNSNEHLKAFVERINNLLDEKERVGADLKELYAEVKSEGFNTKALKKAVAISRKDKDDYLAEQTEIDLILDALGIL